MTVPVGSTRPALAGRTIIVSGGGGPGRAPRGVGEAVCDLCAAMGARVVIANRNRAVAELSAARIGEMGGTALAVTADLSSEAECQRVVAAALDRFGALDGLVGNVAIAAGDPVPETDQTTWDRVFATNAKSLLFLAKHALPVMPPGSAVVTVSSITVNKPSASACYGPSKAAAEALTLQMAWEQGPRGIRCNIVRVGEVWAAMSVRNCVDDDAVRARRDFYRQRTALQSLGDPDDVAHAVAFLLGDGARWITGQTLVLDGGAQLLRGDPAWRQRSPKRDPARELAR